MSNVFNYFAGKLICRANFYFSFFVNDFSFFFFLFYFQVSIFRLYLVELNVKRIERGNERKMNTARTKMKQPCAKYAAGSLVLVIVQRSRGSFFFSTRAADWKGRSGSSTTSALGRSCNFAITRRQSPSPQ